MGNLRLNEDIVQPLVQWLKLITGVQVIVDRPNSPRPTRPGYDPYISLTLVNPLTKVGHSDALQYVGGTTYNLGGQRTFTVGIRAYGKRDPHHMNYFTAHDLLVKVLDACQSPVGRERLDEAGLAIWSVQAIVDVSELLESGFEPRAALDIIMGVASNVEVDLGLIEKVIVEPTVKVDSDTRTDPPITMDLTEAP